MAFKSVLEIVNNVAKITLTGELDAAAAPAFRRMWKKQPRSR